MLPDSSREDSNNATTKLDLVRNYISKERQVTTESNKSNAEFAVMWRGTETQVWLGEYIAQSILYYENQNMTSL